jgi:lipoprotein-anchoring transpeptidase ErfK/SrfK
MTSPQAVRPRGDLFGGRPFRALLAAAVALVAIAAPGTASAANESIVAQAKVPVIALYRSPGAKRPFLRLSNPNRHGVPLVFLVKERRPGGWEKVYVPIRPNGSTAWIRGRQVTLAVNPYRIRVSLGAHTITVWKGARVFHREPAGVGRSIVPTPAGTYYLAELLAQPNPSGAYGPYAFGLSAYSNVLYSFGGGPGQIGLHGTNNPASLGTNASHGCIRISNAGIVKLARILPLGTPVRIGY